MLKDLEEKYKNFEIDFCFTFSLLNQNYVEDTYKYLRQHGINNFHLILARNPVKNKHLLEFDIEKYSLYNKALLRDIFSTKMGLSERIFNIRRRHQAGIIRNVVSDNRFKFKCTAGTLAVVIDELGLVYPCETKKTIFGSLREQDYDFSTIWHSDVAHSFRKTVMSEGCRCTHETNTITNISFSPRFYFKFLTDYLKVNFYGR
jgi:MoaA/NifB/PqqE/SkfB family radical SAM enzyme